MKFLLQFDQNGLCNLLAGVLMHKHAGDLGKDEKVRAASLCARHKKADSGGHRDIIRGLPRDVTGKLSNENAGVLDCIVLCSYTYWGISSGSIF